MPRGRPFLAAFTLTCDDRKRDSWREPRSIKLRPINRKDIALLTMKPSRRTMAATRRKSRNSVSYGAGPKQQKFKKYSTEEGFIDDDSSSEPEEINSAGPSTLLADSNLADDPLLALAERARLRARQPKLEIARESEPPLPSDCPLWQLKIQVSTMDFRLHKLISTSAAPQAARISTGILRTLPRRARLSFLRRLDVLPRTYRRICLH